MAKTLVMLYANQTLEQMAASWLERKFKQLVFGKPIKGEPAYDEEPTFHSTYPKGYLPEHKIEEYNKWIRQIHITEKKKFFSNNKDRLYPFK